ncbi:Tetratricopeptide protein [Streptomyces clavuligerus]|uniref:Tetratricopeptide protein n=1 Tax=Streptomyces clavuligerus TaxID=1901 RepID=E2Q4Y4_STRCL|nr:Tetratricopeptide protein [Streptomyces clavuligerus]
MLLAREGSEREAALWWSRAARAGHGRAALRLALLAARRGELTEAQRWCARAVEPGPAEVTGPGPRACRPGVRPRPSGPRPGPARPSQPGPAPTGLADRPRPVPRLPPERICTGRSGPVKWCSPTRGGAAR